MHPEQLNDLKSNVNEILILKMYYALVFKLNSVHMS